MELMSQRWTDLYNYLNPKEILEEIMELWLKVLNKYAPLKTKIYGISKNKWNFSKGCCQLMKVRDKAKKVAKNSK